MMGRELELSPEDMRALGYRVIDLIVEQASGVRDRPVTRHASREDMEERLREPIPGSPTSPDEILDQVENDIFSHIAYLTHPRFFAFVPSPSNYVSVLAEALTAAFNLFCGSWLVSSGPTQVELVTIDWLRQLCGMPRNAGGLFVSGGSVASLTALAVARRVVLHDRMQDGVVYFSDQTHSAVGKALSLLGFQRDQLRVLPADHSFRLPLTELREAVTHDRAAGRRPFCVVANAGTTNTGAVDPLDELAEFCREQGMWFHVDGAYGAPAILTERSQALLAGLGQADSLVLDPHKWLFQPFEIGCVLVRDRVLLPETFAVHPEYLRDVDRATEEVNFRDYGIQLTRSFRALKLWMSLKVFGLAAFREAVDWGIHLAEVAQRAIAALPHWQVVTPAQLGIVTFRYRPPGMTDEAVDVLTTSIVDAMVADGFALVTSTAIGGRNVLRLCTINPRTTEQDVEETVERLDALARALR